jgi:hypothetical protein
MTRYAVTVYVEAEDAAEAQAQTTLDLDAA